MTEPNGDWVTDDNYDPPAPDPAPGADEEPPELVEARLRSAARIEPLALEEEFIRLPGDIAWWTARHAAAIGENLRAIAYRKSMRGLIWQEAKMKLESVGRKPTVDDVTSIVDSDARYQLALDDEKTTEVERERLKGAVTALLAKRDMLVQLGANHRAEMERDPVIRDRARMGR